jgi:hypothetical protein
MVRRKDVRRFVRIGCGIAGHKNGQAQKMKVVIMLWVLSSITCV